MLILLGQSGPWPDLPCSGSLVYAVLMSTAEQRTAELDQALEAMAIEERGIWLAEYAEQFPTEDDHEQDEYLIMLDEAQARYEAEQDEDWALEEAAIEATQDAWEESFWRG